MLMRLKLNGNDTSLFYNMAIATVAGSYYTMAGSDTILLNANDTVYFDFYHETTATITIAGGISRSYISGYLVAPSVPLTITF